MIFKEETFKFEFLLNQAIYTFYYDIISQPGRI